MTAKTTDSIDNICAVCSEVIDIYAVGTCDHFICFKCSTRMRVLCEQTYCSICRSELPKVIFVKKIHRYDYIETHHFLVNRKHKIYFEDTEVQASFYKLLEHNCRECPVSPALRSFAQLKDHMRKQHSLFYCDICVKHLKIFVHERKYYNRSDLAHHRRVGDKDDKSHKGHPLCEFCDDRFLDNDELLRHLRKEHYFCHFCDAEGSNQYYSDYAILKEHFADQHYLCEEGDCQTAQFTNAFRSEIDLKAHTATEHGKSSKRSQSKQTRTLDIEINLAPRSVRDMRRERARGVTSGEDYEDVGRDSRHRASGRSANARKREELSVAMAITASLAEAERQTGAVSVVPPELVQPLVTSKQQAAKNEQYKQNTEDFPNLDGRTARRDPTEEAGGDTRTQGARSLAQKLAFSSNLSVQDSDMASEEFPALAGAPKPSRPQPQAQPWKSSEIDRAKPSKGLVVQAISNANPNSGSMKDFPVLNRSSKSSDIRPNIPGLNYVSVDKTGKGNKSKDDFPALASLSDSTRDVKPKIPGLNFVTEEKSPVHSPQGSRKTKPSQPKTEKRVSPLQDDYPALGKPKNAVPPQSSFAPKTKPKVPETNTYTPMTFSNPGNPSSLSQISQSLSDQAPLVLKRNDEDFPSLGKLKNNSKSETMNNKKSKKTVNQNEVSSVKSSVPKTEKVKKVENSTEKIKQSEKLVSASKSKSSKKLSDSVSKKEELNQAKSKQPGVTKTSNNILPKDDFPTLGSNTAPAQSNGWIKKPKLEPDKKEDGESEFVTLKSKGKKKKGKKSEDDGPKLEKFADENPFDFIIKDSEKKQAAQGSSITEKQKKIVSDKNRPVKDDDFPSLSETQKENKTVVQSLSLGSDCSDNADFTIIANALKESNFLAQQNCADLQGDFPSLISQTSAPPPPGFTKSVAAASNKPPPGFALVAPPGFSSEQKSLNDKSTSLLPSKNGDSEAQYMRPPYFQQRNVQLIENIRKLIKDDQEKFGKFRTWSGQFRKGIMKSEDYYNECLQLMGKTSFLSIFPELLVLLPDIEKQQQLLQVYNKQPKSVEQRTKKKSQVFKVSEGGCMWNTSGAEHFPVCSVCSQVLTPDDFRPHLVEHNIDEEYPSLSSTVVKGNKHGMSAWVKS